MRYSVDTRQLSKNMRITGCVEAGIMCIVIDIPVADKVDFETWCQDSNIQHDDPIHMETLFYIIQELTHDQVLQIKLAWGGR